MIPLPGPEDVPSAKRRCLDASGGVALGARPSSADELEMSRRLQEAKQQALRHSEQEQLRSQEAASNTPAEQLSISQPVNVAQQSASEGRGSEAPTVSSLEKTRNAILDLSLAQARRAECCSY